MKIELSEFSEILMVYYKKHIYFWNLAFLIVSGYLTLVNPIFLVLPLALPGLIWLKKNFEFGWSTQKIRNLLIYKELTKRELTPLENEVVQRYFGKRERTKLILSHDKVRSVGKKVYAVDFIIICLIATSSTLTALPIINSSTNNNSTDYEILQAYGQLIGLEYLYRSTWLGTSANPTTTIIHLHNVSIALTGNIILELGQNYTISFNNGTKTLVSIKK